MDGVLKAFELRLQMLYARLKDLDRALRTSVRRRHYRLCAWRHAAIALGFTAHDLLALCGGRARGRGRETQRASRPAPRVSISGPQHSARLRDRASVTVKLQAEVPHAGPARTDTPLQTPHRTAAAERFQDRDPPPSTFKQRWAGGIRHRSLWRMSPTILGYHEQ